MKSLIPTAYEYESHWTSTAVHPCARCGSRSAHTLVLGEYICLLCFDQGWAAVCIGWFLWWAAYAHGQYLWSDGGRWVCAQSIPQSPIPLGFEGCPHCGNIYGPPCGCMVPG